MFPVINIGPLAIQASGLSLLLSLFIGLWLTGKFAHNLSTAGDIIENSILYGLLAGILAARIGFMLQNPSIFKNNPLSLFSLSPTMVDAGFGILVGLLTIFIMMQKKHLPLWPTLDSISPLILWLFIGIQIANLANGNAYGLPTEMPWGIQLWNANRHPVQLYAILLSLVLFTWMLVKTKRLKITGFLRSGIIFNFVSGGLALITLFTRAFIEQKMRIGPIDLIQLSAFIILLASLTIISKRAFQPRKHLGAVISLGSNQDPHSNLAGAIKEIQSKFKLRRSSSIYQTEGVKDSKNISEFLNQVVEIETNLSFPELLAELKNIEKGYGRKPGERKIVPLDLDIITYDHDVFTYQKYQIPDPDLQSYRYLALPLAEMSPNFRHPANGQSIKSILESLKDDTLVRKLGEVENELQR